jgi:SNF2 family DNA or RNA helicase
MWGLLPRKVFIIKSASAKIPEDADTLIIGQDMIANQNLKNALFDRFRFDVAIIDEAHAYKNRMALRTKALYGERLTGKGGLISLAERTWILTGTPIPNNSSEIYPHLRALAPERLETAEGRLTATQFLHRFCVVEVKNFGPRSVTSIKGNRNNQELKERLKGFFIRRRKEDVLSELPALQWSTVVLEPPREALKEIKAIEGNPQMNEIRAVLAAAAASHFSKDEGAADAILSMAGKDAISALRRIVGLAKVKPTIDFIKNEFDGGVSKIILFAYHKEVIAQLEQGLAEFNPVVLTGETSRKNRQEAIDRFQKEVDVKLFLGQITAANSAITLTASDNVIILEPSWTPAENLQAAARAHRLGQKSSKVMARYIVLAGSMDEDLTRVIMRKTRQISEVIY